MNKHVLVVFFAGLVSCASSCAQQTNRVEVLTDAQRIEQLNGIIGKLEPLHAPIGKPGRFDWLAQHKETGQTFKQYLKAYPVRPGSVRKILYIRPIGDFSKEQAEIVKLSAEYLGIVYGVEVKLMDTMPLAKIPAEARRKNPHQGMEQVLTTYILNDILAADLPEDAVCQIAFTSADLWPGEGWNFVFGQASLRERAGVWSIYRNGDPAASSELFTLCLKRTIKVAAHETGHMFTMMHCTKYQCNMCGSNSQEESDRQPLAMCPECFAKVCYSCRLDPVETLKKLGAFCTKNSLKDEAEFFRKSLDALGVKQQ